MLNIDAYEINNCLDTLKILKCLNKNKKYIYNYDNNKLNNLININSSYTNSNTMAICNNFISLLYCFFDEIKIQNLNDVERFEENYIIKYDIEEFKENNFILVNDLLACYPYTIEQIVYNHLSEILELEKRYGSLQEAIEYSILSIKYGNLLNISLNNKTVTEAFKQATEKQYVDLCYYINKFYNVLNKVFPNCIVYKKNNDYYIELIFYSNYLLNVTNKQIYSLLENIIHLFKYINKEVIK